MKFTRFWRLSGVRFWLLLLKTAKALELFLRDLVLESTAIAASQGSKKIMPFHV
jgi:hypothetical protein